MSQTHTRLSSSYQPLNDFTLSRTETYQQQYGDIYFLRLAKLKNTVGKVAEEAWEGYEIAGDTVRHVDRVLDVRQGTLCWIVGTVYVDMQLKPNILDDISKDHWIAAPPPRERYTSADGSDKIMLEDESGRLRLVGAPLESQLLVTGCIIAVMGTENSDGAFEVIDLKLPDLPEQNERWGWETKAQKDGSHEQRSQSQGPTGKIALISGLELSGDAGDTLTLDLLMEYLLGEAGPPDIQQAASRITRLFILGDSLVESAPVPINDTTVSTSTHKKATAAPKKYGYDSSAYNPAPTSQLDAFLSNILPSLPVTLMPGASDPANVSLPQQPLHSAMFPSSRAWSDPPSTTQSKNGATAPPPPSHPFHPTTNPAYISTNGRLLLLTSGQPTRDIAKYVPSSESSEEFSTLDLLVSTLRWRLIAPTAPDTLTCYPYQMHDPFVMAEGKCPNVYAVGGAPHFETKLVEGATDSDTKVRCIAVPRFKSTGQLVLVDLEDLTVEVVRLCIFPEG